MTGKPWYASSNKPERIVKNPQIPGSIKTAETHNVKMKLSDLVFELGYPISKTTKKRISATLRCMTPLLNSVSLVLTALKESVLHFYTSLRAQYP
jgi:hypothetical protein